MSILKKNMVEKYNADNTLAWAIEDTYTSIIKEYKKFQDFLKSHDAELSTGNYIFQDGILYKKVAKY